MPYTNPEVKKAKQREAYKKMREEQMRADGIDPDTIAFRSVSGRTFAIKPRRGSKVPQELIVEMLPKPGESREEHRRRRNRLKANFYNSLLTTEDRKARNASVRAAYEKDAVRLRARKKELYDTDPERFREYGRKYFLKNRDERLAKLAEWARNNPERVRAARERWSNSNKGLLNKYSSGYRAQLAEAAPFWTDWDAIIGIYDEAAKKTSITGIDHVVDHIVPINGKDVCGLHVWWNLRVITETLNCRKGNRWLQEEGLAPMQ